MSQHSQENRQEQPPENDHFVANGSHLDLVSLPMQTPDRNLTADLSDLLLGLVSKIPVSDLERQAFHVLKIEANVPGPVNPAQFSAHFSSASSSGSSDSTAMVPHSPYVDNAVGGTTLYEKTFSAQLGNSGTTAILHIQANLSDGNLEVVQVQALRTRDVVGDRKRVLKKSEDALCSPLKKTNSKSSYATKNLPNNNDRKKNHVNNNNNNNNNDNNDDVSDFKKTTSTRRNDLAFGTDEQATYNANSDNAYRIVYQLKLRESTVDAHSLDIETPTGGFSMLWNDELRQKHLHTDPRLQELDNREIQNNALSNALSPEIQTLATERLTAPRLEMAALAEPSITEQQILEEWSSMAMDDIAPSEETLNQVRRRESKRSNKQSSNNNEPTLAPKTDDNKLPFTNEPLANPRFVPMTPFTPDRSESSASSSSDDDAHSSSSSDRAPVIQLRPDTGYEEDQSFDSPIGQFEMEIGQQSGDRRAKIFESAYLEEDEQIHEDLDEKAQRESKPARFFYSRHSMSDTRSSETIEEDDDDQHHRARPKTTPISTDSSKSSVFETAYFDEDGTACEGNAGNVSTNSTPTSAASSPMSSKIDSQAQKQSINVHDWQAEFIEILETTDPTSRVHRMSSFVRQFTRSATRVARQIVAEEHISPHKKTILPMMSFGGVAGGEKYVQDNVFFKFAKDAYKLYGDAEFAQKAAGLELHGLNAIMNARCSGVFLPMLCTVDELGARVVAASMLPIGPRTLMSGVDDGGVGLRKGNANTNTQTSGRAETAGRRKTQSVEDRMKSVAHLLNLKPHTLRGTNRTVYCGSDVEWHLGYDDRLYVVDCARVFPPEAIIKRVAVKTPTTDDEDNEPDDAVNDPEATPPPPNRNATRVERAAFLYRQLRAELVAQYRIPLNSDAFSAFLSPDEQEDNRAVYQATNYLWHDVIPRFARWLFNDDDGSTKLDSRRLVREMHIRGINLRQLGRVRYWLRQAAREASQRASKSENEQKRQQSFEGDKSPGLSWSTDALRRTSALARSASFVGGPGRANQIVLCEMIARVIVLMVRRAWRECRIVSPKHGKSRCKRVAVLFMNLLFAEEWQPRDAGQKALVEKFGVNWWSEYTPLYRNDPGNASDSSKPTSANNDINNNDKTLNHHSNSEPILSKPEPIAPSVDKFKDIPEAPILEAINERLNQSAYCDIDDVTPPTSASSSRHGSQSSSFGNERTQSAPTAPSRADLNVLRCVDEAMSKDAIKQRIVEKYGVLALSRSERSTTFDLRQHADMRVVCDTVVRKLGLKFNARTVAPLLVKPDTVESLRNQELFMRGSSAGDSFVARLNSVSMSGKLERRHRPRTKHLEAAARHQASSLSSNTTVDEDSLLRSGRGGAMLVRAAVVQEEDDEEIIEPVLPRPESAPPQTPLSESDISPVRRLFDSLEASGATLNASGDLKDLSPDNDDDDDDDEPLSRSAPAEAAAPIHGYRSFRSDDIFSVNPPKDGWNDSDLIAIHPIVKHLNFVTYYEAFAYSQKAVALKRAAWRAHVLHARASSTGSHHPSPLSSSSDTSSRVELDDEHALHAAALRAFDKARAAFHEAMRASPSDSHALVAYGRLLAEWASLTVDPTEASVWWDKADHQFAAAHSLAPHDSYPLLNWSMQTFGAVNDFLGAAKLRQLARNKLPAVIEQLPDRFVAEVRHAATSRPTVTGVQSGV